MLHLYIIEEGCNAINLDSTEFGILFRERLKNCTVFICALLHCYFQKRGNSQRFSNGNCWRWRTAEFCNILFMSWHSTAQVKNYYRVQFALLYFFVLYLSSVRTRNNLFHCGIDKRWGMITVDFFVILHSLSATKIPRRLSRVILEFDFIKEIMNNRMNKELVNEWVIS